MDGKLKKDLIKIILDSGENFITVMKTIKDIEWYFLSRAETFLINTEIGKVSESPSTPYVEFLPQIMEQYADKPHEDQK